MWVWKLLLSGISTVIGPVFEFLNKRVDANERMHVSDNATIVGLGGSIIAGQTRADELKAEIRLREGKWSPWVIITIGGFMMPFGWHTWQVVLDSSRWLPCLGRYYLPNVCDHVVGSWRVAALPGMFETTEHAVIQSLFIGASAAVGAIPIIAALRRR